MKILVVDDTRTARLYFSESLRKAAHEVYLAEDGESGIACAKTTLPDLILMNRMMPGINGFQATYKLKRNDTTKHIPIIMYSLNADVETDRVQALSAGAQLYVDDFSLLAAVALYVSTNGGLRK